MKAPKRKLIEVALPLDVINAEAAREKSIRHGHPSTLHLWWARRPLAACRAVLFAQLVDDPSSLPEDFPTEEAQDVERQRLFGIIEELVKWDNSTNETVLEAARVEIMKSTGGNPPPILDPFAGGGSIPLEAQRLGLEAYASDLNPVAVLINKALIEIPPKWANQPPVHPDAEQRMSWSGAEGLAEDVRKYAKWMRDEAEKRIGHLYPKAKLEDGSEANVIAWIWARTITCPNPACGAIVPLVRSFWVNKRTGQQAWLKPSIRNGSVDFHVVHDGVGPEDNGTMTRSGARCLVCSHTTDLAAIRSQGLRGLMDTQLLAIVASDGQRRFPIRANSEHAMAANLSVPDSAPDELIADNPRYLAPPLYGMKAWGDLFSNRQLHLLTTFSDLVHEAGDLAKADARNAIGDKQRADEYAIDLSVYLAFLVDKLADTNSSLCSWQIMPPRLRATFGRQALPMVWDFAEANPFGGAAGDIGVARESIAKVLERLTLKVISGRANQADARTTAWGASVVATDPPYYDNIGYADLSDYFYVWLRRSLSGQSSSSFATLLTPKIGELIATPYRHGGSKAKAEEYFEAGFVDAFRSLRKANPDYPMSFFYAFKQSESDDVEGLGSTGWSTMLEGLFSAGWMVTATWPMRTELSTRNVGRGSNALASSVVLACRPRGVDAGVTDRQGLLRALGERLPDALADLQKASIAPVDLRQAAIGPGMAVFSQFEKVVEPDGSAMRVRTALGLINQVLDQVLDAQQAEFDRETRWAIQWFSQFFDDEGPYGTAETLAVSMDVSIEALRESGILTSGGGKVRLLSRAELSLGWDPTTVDRVSVWETTQHLVKRLDEDGESAAADLYGRLGGVADSVQTLAIILYSKAERARPGLAGPYNAMVASWPTIQRLARQSPFPSQPQQQTIDGL